MDNTNNKEELRNKLKQKINQQKIGRSSGVVKENYKNKQLKALGLDEQKYNESLELIKKLSEDERKKLFESLQNTSMNL
jgi:hypothetical protein